MYAKIKNIVRIYLHVLIACMLCLSSCSTSKNVEGWCNLRRISVNISSLENDGADGAVDSVMIPYFMTSLRRSASELQEYLRKLGDAQVVCDRRYAAHMDDMKGMYVNISLIAYDDSDYSDKFARDRGVRRDAAFDLYQDEEDDGYGNDAAVMKFASVEIVYSINGGENERITARASAVMNHQVNHDRHSLYSEALDDAFRQIRYNIISAFAKQKDASDIRYNVNKCRSG